MKTMRIAAVGDSVNWGQGLKQPLNWNNLKNEEKYIFKCVEWLREEGIEAKFDPADFLAHSGAIIGALSDEHFDPSLKLLIDMLGHLYAQSAPIIKALSAIKNEAKYDLAAMIKKIRSMNQGLILIDPQAFEALKEKIITELVRDYELIFERYYGEIPDRYPTILSQLSQLKNKISIDILFINGGPNDIGILETVSFNDDFQSALRIIDEFAASRVAVLLEEARRVCPNALIVYTGYYPGLSPDSDIPPIREVALEFNAVSPALTYLVYNFGIGFFFDLFKISQQDRLKRQGLIFHKRMLGKFREQIGIFNENRAVDTLPIIFSPSGFGSLKRAELVSSTGIDPNKKVTINRKAICKKIAENYDLDYDDKLMCESAFVAHPNVRGANVYFKALKKRIDNQLNYSLRKHLETIDKDIMSIRELKDKYKFIPIRSIRNLTDVLWLDSILIDYTISIDGLNQSVLKYQTGYLTTDIPPDALNETPRRFDDPLLNSEIKPLLEILPRSTITFDFGIANYIGLISFYNSSKIKDSYVIDIRGVTNVKELRYIEIRLPRYFEFLTFSMRFSIRVNGYNFQELTLNQNSFSEVINNRTNEIEYLEYKKYL